MLAENTIRVPFRLHLVTHGLRFCASVLTVLASQCFAALIEDPPSDLIASTNITTHGHITVHQLTVGPLAANCFLVADVEKNAIVIDPGASPNSLIGYIKDQGIHVVAYVMTHSHLDHISALDELSAALPAEVAMHPEENDWAFCEKNAWLPHYPRTREVVITRVLQHQQTFADGGLSYTVIHTPGHSPGSVCLWFPQEKLIFTGDTLFAGTVGRTDLHRSSSTSLIRSLGVFFALPIDTVIYAGHGRSTTVRAELKTNPFMQEVPNPPKAKTEHRSGDRSPSRTEEKN
jgi:glyoxylase-like metal-dependent hydrolase (beta-lactamase superfamily II)